MRTLSFILAILAAVSVYTFVQAADTGFVSPTAASNDTSVGTGAWASPENIFSSDDADASRGGFSGTFISNYLKAQTFGFSIPTGATIDGIEVQIEKLGSTVTDEHVRIVKADGTIGSENKADTTTSWPDIDAYVTYGGSTDKWSETWTAEDINDADFGVVISADVVHPASIAVDHIQIKVYYTEAAANPAATGAVRSSSMQIRGGTMQVR